MSALEATGQLNRKVETLPNNAEFSERYATGKPLTRPEIGVLLSYAKLTLFDALVASTLPDESYLQHLLVDYFPAKMQKNTSGVKFRMGFTPRSRVSSRMRAGSICKPGARVRPRATWRRKSSA